MERLSLLLATFSTLLVLSVVVGAGGLAAAAFAPAPAPVQVAWSRSLPLTDGQSLGDIFICSASTPALAAVSVVGGQRTLVGLDLADGSLLWRAPGLADEYDGVNYTVPFVRAGSLRLGAVVADYHLTVEVPPNDLLEWSGFAILDTKSGKALMQRATGSRDTNTAQLSRWGFLYIITTIISDHRTILRLQEPDYSLTRPAASMTFPSSSYSSSIRSNLHLGQRQGVLLNQYSDEEGNTITLMCLEPATLKPLWTLTGLTGSLEIAEPVEDVVVVVNATTTQPWVTQLTTYSINHGSSQFMWKVRWSTPEQVGMHYLGTALNRRSGEARYCTRFSTGLSSMLKFTEWLTCIDPLTSNVTLNFTLKASGEQAARASFMGIYASWALIKDESTGVLQAYDCFTSPVNISQPSPVWVIPDQGDLSQLSMSDDRLTFILATYKSGRIARWSYSWPRL